MKHTMSALALAVLSALIAVDAVAGGDPPDLLEYIARIRESGMSESARGALGMIAGVRAGSTILKYERADGSPRYWATFTSTGCPLPGADPGKVAEWQASLRAKEEAEFERLKPLADKDGSGFVSTEEGNEFRELMEFGVLAEQVREAEGPGLEKVAMASGLEMKEAEAKLERYRSLLGRLPAEKRATE